jgi:hypothetical protein
MPFVVADRSALYFSTNRVAGQAFEIFRAELTDGVVTSVGPAPGVNSAASDMYPVATADERTLYFASARDSSGYDLDIFVATRLDKASAFGDVTKLPAAINDRTAPTTANYPDHVTADGCVLYFTRVTSGREQIWRVARN